MKLILFSLLGTACLLASCQSLPKAATQAVAGAAGAYIGHEVSGGEPEGAVLGAAAGAVAGTAFDYWKDSGERKAYSTGYVKGQSDEVKRLYWITKRLHEGDGIDGGLNRGYYELPVPEHVSRDGVVIEAHTQVVEVIEP